MKNEDIELIHRILSGDETAFVSLVNKYKKQVHALAWRKIGDFHIAEEITQDTFLKVYQKLSTLKNPNQFSGWLYVIATNQCRAWLRKKRIETESLDDTENEWIDPAAYSRYVAEEQAKVNVEAQREVVKKLLAKLKESERTVITLHYFGEMTIEEISRFLGVSASAIKLRLHRARQRLQKEEPMIREALSNFQLSPNLTDNIMRKVENTKPTTPSGSKPFIPWVAGASTAILIVLMLGVGTQNLERFQQPYSIDAQSEIMVELVDTPVVQNLEEKLDIRNQQGQRTADAQGKGDGSGGEADQVLSDEGDYAQWRLPENAKARLGKGSISGNVAYSPDGKLLAVGSTVGIWIHDAQTGKELDFFSLARSLVRKDGEHIVPSEYNHHIGCIEFSPDGKILASGGWNQLHSVVLWDVTTGQQKAAFQRNIPNSHGLDVRCLSFSSDGKTLASGQGDGIITLWDIKTGKQKKLSGVHSSHVYGMSFSPTDNQLLVSGSSDELWLWDVDKGKHQSIYINRVMFDVEPDGSKIYVQPSVLGLSFSSDGKTLATTHVDRTVRLWDIETKTEKSILKGHTEFVHKVQFSPDGKTLVGGCWKETVLLWDVTTGEQKATLTGHTSEIDGVAFSADGSTIASTDGNTVRLWDATTGKQKSILQGFTPRINSIEYSPDGTVIASAGSDGTVRLWNATSRNQEKTLIGHYESVRDISFSTDGKTLVSGGEDNKLCLWNVKTGKLLRTYEGHTDKVISVSFNGQSLASASRDQIWLWDIVTGEPERTLFGHNGIVSEILFSPDGKILASGSLSKSAYAGDNSVLLWNVETGERLTNLDGILRGVTDLNFSPDGKMLACASRERYIFLRDINTKEYCKVLFVEQPIFKITPNGEKVWSDPIGLSVHFSPDGKKLLSGHTDKTLRIWDISTEQQTAIFIGRWSHLSISPDGETLASGSSDGTILLWDLTSLTNTNQHSQ